MQHYLAQINIAKFRLPKEDPANAEFIANLDRVNALAEAAPGFVWRLKGEGNDATDIEAFDDPAIIVNMSVWRDFEALTAFVYETAGHREIMRRRREWFERLEVYLALWWIPEGHVPTVSEGKERLEMLARRGPSPAAFVFRQPFAAPSSESATPPSVRSTSTRPCEP